MINKKRYIPYIILMVFLSIALFSCSKDEEVVLAKVGNFEINSSDYMKRLKTVREKLSLPDNGEIRMNFLKSYIDEKLLLVDSEKRGFNSDAAAAEKLDVIKVQNLLDLYSQKEIYDPVEITNDDLKRHFAKMNIKLRVRHLYADNRQTADSLRNLLANGATFEKLAKEVFTDPRLKETGGDLGYMGFDEMQMDFADEAFKLEIGQISEPVKTNYGYSIIKVEDRLGNPFLTETEFLKQKTAIYRSYYQYIQKRAAKDYVAGLENDVQFNEQVFNQLYDELGSASSKPANPEALQQKSAIDEDAVLLTANSETWDIKTFRQKAKYTSEGQRNWIRNKETLKEFILGLVSREKILTLAREKGYDELDEYTIAVNKEFNTYQIDRVKKDILESIETPEDSLLQFYQTNKEIFIEPGKANLREIVLDNPQDAEKVKKLIFAGKSFKDVAREMSINRHTAVFGGDMGFVKYSELGPYREKVMDLKPGEWTGPFKRGSVYFYWQCIEQQSSRVIGFEEAKEQVISGYKKAHFDIAMQNKINEIRSNTQVASYPKKLRYLKYN